MNHDSVNRLPKYVLWLRQVAPSTSASARITSSRPATKFLRVFWFFSLDRYNPLPWQGAKSNHILYIKSLVWIVRHHWSWPVPMIIWNCSAAMVGTGLSHYNHFPFLLEQKQMILMYGTRHQLISVNLAFALSNRAPIFPELPRGTQFNDNIHTGGFQRPRGPKCWAKSNPTPDSSDQVIQNLPNLQSQTCTNLNKSPTKSLQTLKNDSSHWETARLRPRILHEAAHTWPGATIASVPRNLKIGRMEGFKHKKSRQPIIICIYIYIYSRWRCVYIYI